MAIFSMSRLFRRSLAVGAVLAACLVTAPAMATTAGTAGTNWVGTWGASPIAASSVVLTVTHLAHQTVREIVYSSVGGNRVRIRVSNVFGTQTVTIGRASISVEMFGAQVKNLHALTFGGRPSVRIPRGADVLSDP